MLSKTLINHVEISFHKCRASLIIVHFLSGFGHPKDETDSFVLQVSIKKTGNLRSLFALHRSNTEGLL